VSRGPGKRRGRGVGKAKAGRVGASVRQAGCGRWRAHGGREGGWRLPALSVQVFEDLFNDGGVFDAGDDPHGIAAAGAGVDVDLEHAFEPLRPGHRGMAFDGGPGRARATTWSAA